MPDLSLASVVVVPRERFSCARASLESVYEHTRGAFELIYVDGRSPRQLRRHLESEARDRGFRLVRTRQYLSPNQARNIGARLATRKYVVFIDNDVIVTPGWLDALVDCAEATGAAIVGPLVCQGRPLHTIVHCAGGHADILLRNEGETVTRHLREGLHHPRRRVDGVGEPLRRAPTGLAEFHCMLVERRFLDEVGLLDEGLLNTREHVDICLTAAMHGRTIYFEPDSVVTYVTADRLEWSDVRFYMLRWSDAWELASLAHMQEKWQLADDYFAHRRAQVGSRRRTTIVRPLVRRLPIRRGQARLENALVRVDRLFNRLLTARYMRKYGGRAAAPTLVPQSSPGSE